MTIDFHDRKFRAVANVPGGDSGADTIFHYRQSGPVVWATYQGGAVEFGTLVARIDADGALEMRYSHLGADGVFRTGECRSVPEVLTDGRLRLHETWRWTSGSEGSGESIVEEIAADE